MPTIAVAAMARAPQTVTRRAPPDDPRPARGRAECAQRGQGRERGQGDELRDPCRHREPGHGEGHDCACGEGQGGDDRGLQRAGCHGFGDTQFIAGMGPERIFCRYTASTPKPEISRGL
jgi:hypothetical protein